MNIDIKDAILQLEYARCNFLNAPSELYDYYYFKLKAAESLVNYIILEYKKPKVIPFVKRSMMRKISEYLFDSSRIKHTL